MNPIFIVILLVVMYVLGILTGVFGCRIFKLHKRVGRFLINSNDPKKPAFWLELDYDLDVLEKQRSIEFQIKHHTIPS